MKVFKFCISVSVLTLTLAIGASAHWIEGRIFCDANQNGQIDAGDPPLPGILVVVTNTSGTFSNAAFSGNDGLYIVGVSETNADNYVAFLNPATVPPDSGILLPASGLYNFTINSNIYVGDWLINNPLCQLDRDCWLTGGGTIGTGKQPTHSFGGVVFPGCSPTPGQGGQWTHTAHSLRLQFQGRVITTVNCGNVQGIPPGSKSPVTPFNFIEFQGTGRLKGIAGNKTDLDVNFIARIEDRGEPGSRGAKNSATVDRYYLRVFNGSGTTLLLVSGDTANPLNIVPVPVTTGNMQMHKCQ